MNFRARSVIWLLVLLGVGAALFFYFRRDLQADFGPMAALCPGPDHYGYTCAPGGQFAYINATTDTGLYDDDGTITLALPFPFTFYGTTYTSVVLGSNGTLQFGEAGVAEFGNVCLDQGPAPAMGDMIAVYWDDLTLTQVGYLETAVAGEAPNRIFVVEWDAIPRYGADLTDTLTFAVQLFEGSNDIVLLYQDVTALQGRGRSATIGLQSAAQGLSLQFSCNQPTLADGVGLAFMHSATANRDVGLATAVSPVKPPVVAAKGPVQELLHQLSQREPDLLPRLQRAWLAQNPPRRMVWHELDLTGNGRNELLVIWQGPAQQPHLSQLALLAAHEDGSYALLLDQPLSRRHVPVYRMALVETADFTGDGLVDALLWDEASGETRVVTYVAGQAELLALPMACQRAPGLRVSGDSLGINCPGSESVQMAVWNGREFTLSP